MLQSRAVPVSAVRDAGRGGGAGSAKPAAQRDNGAYDRKVLPSGAVAAAAAPSRTSVRIAALPDSERRRPSGASVPASACSSTATPAPPRPCPPPQQVSADSQMATVSRPKPVAGYGQGRAVSSTSVPLGSKAGPGAPATVQAAARGREPVLQVSATTQVAAPKGAGRGRGTAGGRGVTGKRSSMDLVKVFVRWRPLVEGELKNGEAMVKQTCSEEAGVSAISVTSDKIRTKTWTGNGFSGVFRDGEDNNAVFQRALAPSLTTVLAGHAACCFCYGHTGSGKTHTILGYGPELGMYRLAATQLFESLSVMESQPRGGLHLSVRFAELHNGRAYDLMDNRGECQVREDADGQVHFRKDPKVEADGRVRVRPMVSLRCSSAQAVATAVALGSKLRVVGSSSLHDRSSRSHAILEMEIVTEELLEAREAIIHEESLLIPLGKALDEFNFNEAENPSHDEASVVKRERLQACVVEQVAKVAAAREQVTEVRSRSLPCVGGSLVLVDLAGAEHGSDAEARGKQQKPEEVREAKEINQSLLFLKEVIRALAAGTGHVPYRSCRLTRVMRHWLRDGCCCTMLANLTSSDHHVAKTVNTLQYAALVASAGC